MSLRRTLLIASLVTMLLPGSAYGITTEDDNAVINGSIYYLANDEDCSQASTAGTTPLNGKDNLEKAYHFFRDRGLGPTQAAAIIGNLEQESGQGLNPKAVNSKSGAYGIAQWLGGRLKNLYSFAGSRPVDDLGTQLDFLWYEVTVGSEKNDGALDGIRAAGTDLAKAVTVWEVKFERAGTAEANIPARIRNAQAILGPGGPGAGDTGGGTTTGNPSTDALTGTNSGCGASVSGGCTGGVILTVPAGGKGTNTCYFNQSQISGGGYNWPGCGCLPTSTLTIRATLENNPKLDPVEVLNGVRSKGGVYSDGCSGVVTGALAYLRSLGYQADEILPEHAHPTDATLATIKDKLGQGYMFLTHTSVSVDSAGTSGTSGHFLVLYAVDSSGNFYVSNPGARADNNKPISPDRVKQWLDGFWAVKK